MSGWAIVLGLGAAAFFVRLFLAAHPAAGERIIANDCLKGRAGLVALRRSQGGAGLGPLGRSYYKGGFEPKMTKREAALILQLPYVYTTGDMETTGQC